MADLQAFIGVTTIGVILLDQEVSLPPSRPACMQAEMGRLDHQQNLALLREKRASAIRQYLKYRMHYLKAAME